MIQLPDSFRLLIMSIKILATETNPALSLRLPPVSVVAAGRRFWLLLTV